MNSGPYSGMLNVATVISQFSNSHFFWRPKGSQMLPLQLRVLKHHGFTDSLPGKLCTAGLGQKWYVHWPTSGLAQVHHPSQRYSRERAQPGPALTSQFTVLTSEGRV